jgi:hypothetical protein
MSYRCEAARDLRGQLGRDDQRQRRLFQRRVRSAGIAGGLARNPARAVWTSAAAETGRYSFRRPMPNSASSATWTTPSYKATSHAELRMLVKLACPTPTRASRSRAWRLSIARCTGGAILLLRLEEPAQPVFAAGRVSSAPAIAAGPLLLRDYGLRTKKDHKARAIENILDYVSRAALHPDRRQRRAGPGNLRRRPGAAFPSASASSTSARSTALPHG